MFVYLDETEFGEGAFSGYASLITEKRIDREIIEEALENLRKDPDRFLEPQKAMDDRTLERGFFHAADDSKNAHSHLCNAINKHIKGNFKSHIFHVNKHNFSDTEEIYDLASKLAVVGLFSKSRELTFIFEGRNGLNVQKLLEKWWPDLWRGLSQNCFLAPFIVKYYPDVKFETSDKSNPGSQVVDFILWASQRAVYSNDSKWFDRIEGWAKSRTTTIDGGWDGHSITRLPPEDQVSKRYDVEDSLRETSLLDIDNALASILINVQKVINTSHSRPDKTHIHHFHSDIDFLFKNRHTRQNPEFISKMADCFIKLFDNIELISRQTPANEKTFWLIVRKCMGFALRDGMEASHHRFKLSDTRNHLIDSHLELFDEGIF
ncbi:DUF3800 domain-containing protein [Pseudomonas sp. RIT-To-2]|uniref:DUF3800 domain-containing protein n=1 Tax=Pseudomonas sp. RIT-To-2 TaxID=3462541 RepID=UPI002413A8E5